MKLSLKRCMEGVIYWKPKHEVDAMLQLEIIIQNLLEYINNVSMNFIDPTPVELWKIIV